MHDVLTKIVFALEAKLAESKMHATILLQERRNDRFRIFDQFPSECFRWTGYRWIPISVLAAICFLGRRPEHRPIHSQATVSTWHQNDFRECAAYGCHPRSEIVENAFKITQGSRKVGRFWDPSLGFRFQNEASIPGDYSSSWESGPDSELILCLGCSSADALGALEFNVLLVTANLLGIVLE